MLFGSFGVRLINCAPRIETKVYIKPTNSGLLLHYQSHVDNRYKRGLIVTMLNRAYRLSSHWSHFTEECDRLREVFLKLKYPLRLITTAISICNRMRPSRIKDKFSRVFSKFSPNYPSCVATRAICENFENTSENAITCL